DRPEGERVLALWRAPRLTGLDRRILPCSIPGGGAYLVAGDARGASVFATADGARFERWPEAPRGLTDETEVTCDHTGVAITRRSGTLLEQVLCTAAGCAL